MENKKIFKYPLKTGHCDETTIELISGSKLLDVGTQDGKLFVWFELPYSGDCDITRIFKTIYTGNFFDSTNLKFIKTVVFPNRYFVVHIYEKITENFLSDEEMTI